jgi:hypothetical protein
MAMSTETPGLFVSEVVDDLREALQQFPDGADWRVGVATYTDGPGSDISVMYAASFEADPDGAFVLVPEGMGEAFGLDERPFTARDLLDRLEASPEWAGHAACVCSDITERSDGSLVARTLPLWGAGVHADAQLVYFYYGAGTADAVQ